ncbi:hypothetical protein MLD38_014426 [Melastoma candidum]|uniref:Uncharacterized protein n=1 Tax=Melastoma candidum TaxID=119954 RepID=A0ACB9RCD1_9MYRT|nr:hypothetical protein MLD38_014426 [Melastoma candidum]
MMVAVVVKFLLSLFFLKVSATSDLLESTVCGADRLAYASYSGGEWFSVNEDAVDRVEFCRVLSFHRENGCTLAKNFDAIYCGENISSDKSRFNAGRKILETQAAKDSCVNERNSLSCRIKANVAVLGLFAICCAFLFQCVYRKRKEAATDSVLSKDDRSMDYGSSSEVIPASEKIPGSPLRVPGSPYRVPPSPSRFSMSPKASVIGSLQISMSQIMKATRSFSPSMQIGEGGFGTVYKAQLEDGRVVAVKRAKRELFESLQDDFRSEVELLSKIDHRSLVRLLGYLEKGNERLIITEYVPNGTLRDRLDGQHGDLDFNQRLEILIDVSHGLAYLHLYSEKQIIHRDVKSSNILLTGNLRAKVADFGFARLGSSDTDKTHISTKVKGTVGYLDPEYMRTYQLTAKSDVYSFGILLLEIMTGRRPVEPKRPMDERVTLRWAFKKFNEGNVWDLVDPRMGEIVDHNILSRTFSLAFECAAPIRANRPDMKTVGEQLWAIRVDYLKTRSLQVHYFKVLSISLAARKRTKQEGGSGSWGRGRIVAARWVRQVRECPVRESDRTSTMAAFSRLKVEDTRKILPAEFYPSWVVFTQRQNILLRSDVDEAASELIKASVEPVLEQYTPVILSSMKFSKFTLGTVAPQFTGVSIFEEGKEGGITMELEMNWDGNPSIILDIKNRLGVALPVQVKNIGFTGVFRLIFKPLVDEFPCFGAVSDSLREKKKLDFTLKVVGGDMLAIPGVSSEIEDTIKDAVEGSITWPVRKVIPILPCDYSDLELKPVGTLDVKLVQAKKLTNKDLIGKSDPYAILYIRPLRDLMKKSKIINNELNSIWNEHFKFIVEVASTQNLIVKISDDEGLQASELIGCAHVRLKDLQPGKVKDVWLKLFKDLEVQRDNKYRGEVHLELLYCPYAMESSFTDPFKREVTMTSLEKVLKSGVNGVEVIDSARVYLVDMIIHRQTDSGNSFQQQIFIVDPFLF